MEKKGWWSTEEEAKLRDEERMAVLRVSHLIIMTFINASPERGVDVHLSRLLYIYPHGRH